MSSPFFEYYMDDIYAVLDSGEESLLTMNTRLVHTIAGLIGIQTPIEFTRGDYIAPASDLLRERGISDFRDSIHPKKPAMLMESLQMNKPYWQVFTNKQGFVPNLSILDLLFNEGPNAISYLELL